MEVLLFFIKWGILFGLFILPLARKGVSSGVQCFFIRFDSTRVKLIVIGSNNFCEWGLSSFSLSSFSNKIRSCAAC